MIILKVTIKVDQGASTFGMYGPLTPKGPNHNIAILGREPGTCD